MDDLELSITCLQKNPKIPNTYFIQGSCSYSIPLINSFMNLVTKNVSSVDSSSHRIFLNAFSVTTLKEFRQTLTNPNVKYQKTLDLILSLGQQLEYLIETENVSFYEYNPENVIVIDEKIFVYLSNNVMRVSSSSSSSSGKHTMEFRFPFIRAPYLLISPELTKIQSIPCTINHKTIYYSLGLLSTFLLLNERIEEFHLDELNFLKNTKLYWLLLRCLDLDPLKRTIVYL
jgi:hypothetical protein